MGILIDTKRRQVPFKLILLIVLAISLPLAKCQEELQQSIRIVGQVYAHLPQIPEQYSIVPLIVASTQVHPISSRFVAKRSGDYFVIQSADQQHLATKYNFIRGKNIFTPSYINSQILDQTEETLHVVSDQKSEKQSNTKGIQQSDKQKEAVQTIDPKDKEEQKLKHDQKSEDTQTKSTQIYNQFKNIEALRQKNLRDNNFSQSQEQKTKNLYKLIGYIVIGLVLSFAILKRATKTPPSLPKANQQRSQLRLRDTPDDQDQDDASSSESD